jgi:glycosyltransferase involved in cell wall biosynthesis
MEQSPLINILIRTSNRPQQFTRCLESIRSQTYKNVRIIVGIDRASALDYIPKGLQAVFLYADNSIPYFYDLYCNYLKLMVTDGWFFFLDDDDTLVSPTVLQQLAEHLTSEHEAIICQMLRNGVPKPADNYIRKRVIWEGKTGLPCLVLHSKHKALSGLDGYKAGDYRYIKAVTDQVPTKFIALPLVDAGIRGHGKMDPNSPVSNISE